MLAVISLLGDYASGSMAAKMAVQCGLEASVRTHTSRKSNNYSKGIVSYELL